MTDARFPERWLNDRRLLRLSDPAFRLFVVALMWSVANRSDGVVYDDDLRLMPVVDPSRAAEIAKTGLWCRVRDYWQITEFAHTQSDSEDLARLAARRLADRKRKAKERERKALSRDESQDTSRDVTQDAVGQDRTGQDRHLGVTETQPVADDEERWPPVTQPNNQWAIDAYDKER